MDFVAFSTVVLKKLIEAADSSPAILAYGVPEWEMGKTVFGETALDQAFYEGTSRHAATLTAASALASLGLLGQADSFLKGRLGSYIVTDLGRRAVGDMTAVWQPICAHDLRSDHALLLCIVNRLGSQSFDDYGFIECVDGTAILAEEDWTGDRDHLWGIAAELERRGFLLNRSPIGMIHLYPTYRGLVWETRRKLTVDSGEIDALVEEGETPIVDLKRQLAVDTASEKAELIKDVVALANSRGAGPRYLLIGFSNDGTFYEPTDDDDLQERDRLLDRLAEDRLQVVITNHTTPSLRVRYTEVAYRLGRVGKLEIVRDAIDLPYAVSKAVGARERGLHRVEADQVFLRDGTLTREARPEEIEALRAIALRARERRESREDSSG